MLDYLPGRILLREGGGAREDRLRHRWRLLQIAEKTGRSVDETALRLGLKRRESSEDYDFRQG